MGWLGSERPEPRAVYPRRYRVSVIGENADDLEYYLNSGNAAGWKLVEIIHVPMCRTRVLTLGRARCGSCGTRCQRKTLMTEGAYREREPSMSEEITYAMWGYSAPSGVIAREGLTHKEGMEIAKALRPQFFLLLPEGPREVYKDSGGIRPYIRQADGSYALTSTARVLQPMCPNTLMVVGKARG